MTNCSVALVLLLGAMAIASAADDHGLALPPPTRLVLYLDGLRLIHRIPVQAGRSRILLPDTAGTLVAVENAETWVEENRIDEAVPTPMPALLGICAEAWAVVDRKERIVAAKEEAVDRMAQELDQRLGQRAVTPVVGEADAWQAALDGIIALQQSIGQERQAVAEAWRDVRARADIDIAPGVTSALVLGMGQSDHAVDLSDPMLAALRAWHEVASRSTASRAVVVERSAPGTVVVICQRQDVKWTPRARLVVSNGSAELVRQAAITVPAGVTLAAIPTRLIGSKSAQPLTGNPLVPRQITAETSPTVDRRSVTTTSRSAEWIGSGSGMAGREQSWELPALTLAAGESEAVEVMAELQKGPVALLADEWVLAPDLFPQLTRRLSVRLDGQMLAAGTLELVVDGTVLGRRPYPEAPAGTILHLAAGEDQRAFLAQTTRWEEDPNRPVNKKRDGADYRIRNLSNDPLRFACYLTVPISMAKGVSVTIDDATTAGWKEVQPGIMRWDIALKPGEQIVLRQGWRVDAEGKIKL